MPSLPAVCASVNATVQAHIRQHAIACSASSSESGPAWPSVSRDFAGTVWIVSSAGQRDAPCTITVRSRWRSNFDVMSRDVIESVLTLCPDGVKVASPEPGCFDARWAIPNPSPGSARDSVPVQLQSTIDWLSTLRFVMLCFQAGCSERPECDALEEFFSATHPAALEEHSVRRHAGITSYPRRSRILRAAASSSCVRPSRASSAYTTEPVQPACPVMVACGLCSQSAVKATRTNRTCAT
jgi:hypothetical protein